MDFEDSFASAPVRYALDDIDSDEEIETCANNDKVTIETTLNLQDVNSKFTLVFGLDGPGNVYLNSLEAVSTTEVGAITRSLEEKKETKASILQLSDTTLLIPFSSEIDPDEAGKYTKSIFTTLANRIERVIVLDSFTAVGYTSEVWGDDLTPPFLRVLQTTAAPKMKGLTLYEAPNMIKGVSASIVNYCEVHSIPCYDLLSLQESIYGKLLITAEILQAYNRGLHELGLDIKFSEQLMKDILISRHRGRVDDNHHRLYL